MDLNLTCRSCMKKMTSRSKKNNYTKTVEMFCFCLNVKISEEDNLPKQFCSICVSKIESSYTFITQAQKVDLTLRNLLSRAETSVIVKPERKNSTENKLIKCEFPEQNESSDFVLKVEVEKDSAENTSAPLIEISLLPNEQCNNAITKLKPDIIDSNDNFNHHEDDNIITDDEITDLECNNVVENDVVEKNKTNKEKKVCPICTRTFGSALWYHKHLKKEHGKKNFSCKICSKSFQTLTKCKSHFRYAHPAERNFSCAECGKRYKRRKQLAEHMRSHEESKPFVCDICSKSFKKKSVLLYHMMYHKDRTHLCNVCGLSFAAKSNLVTHMRVHSGEKPYRCGECPKAFNTSSSRRRHERLHRGEQPYVCDTCAKPFSCLSSLNRHRRTHTGEQPYQCPWCPQSFVDSWKRKVHIMRMHGTGLAEIPRLAQDGSILDARGRPPTIRHGDDN